MRMMVAWLVILTSACDAAPEEAHQAAAEPIEAPSGARSAPEGPGRWIREIRDGIRDLPSEATTDPLAARRRAVELYITRQEALERGWGPGGSESPDSGLARKVTEAEASFHTLLALLNRSQSPDSVQVAAAVDSLDARLQAVLTAVDEAR